MITIENLNQNNETSVRELYLNSLQDNKEGFVQDPNFHGDIVDQAYELASQGGVFFVGEEAGKVIGFGALKPNQSSDVKSFELCKLHVSKKSQGKGYGKELSEFAIDTAKKMNAQYVDLHVTNTQKAAIGLYQKLGFIQTSQKVYDVKLQDQIVSFDTIFMKLDL